MSAIDVFSRVYAKDAWNGGSGPGSAPETTVEYRAFLQAFVDALPPASRVVDLGCGDWRIGELIDWSNVVYVGVDVVPSVIEANLQRDTPDNVTFVRRDALADTLPDGDVLIVKDVLQHWPNRSVRRFLTQQLQRYTYLVVTNDVSSVKERPRVNADIQLGGWRPVNVEQAPFSFTATRRLDYPVLDTWVKRVTVLTKPSEETP